MCTRTTPSNLWVMLWLGLKCSLFQVVEVWYAWPWCTNKPMPILARFGGQLLRVRISFGAAQSRRVPGGLQLTGQRVLGLTRHGWSWSPWVYETPCFRRRRESHIWGSGFVGGRGRGGSWEVKELSKRPEWLVLLGMERKGLLLVNQSTLMYAQQKMEGI